ncbi:MAG: 3'-5' exonuclease [Bacteroidales bacterium]
MQTYLKELNDVQRKAVENTEGPSLVIAGAGSGKTRVLTYRIAHMLYGGKHPSSILAITFTNKAAREMKNRISALIGEQAAKYLWMGTFHSIFAKLLRMECKAIEYPSNYTIYDTQDSKNLIKSIVKELKFDPNIYKSSEILNRISFSKNNLVTAKHYAQNQQIIEADKFSRKPETWRIYQMYENRCKAAGAMDFDDILIKTNFLFSKFPDILKKYQQKFRYILVDEYQDTNYSQYLIIKHLADKHHNICVVGDDAQSIYAFRGARIENILNFKNDYPEYKLYKLEQNYRSTKNIVNAANSVIDKNKNQIPKNVFSEKEPGNKIKVIEAYTDFEEAHIVAGMIAENRLRNHDSYNNFAILYRTNAQSRILEEALRKRNIPYQIFGGISFYQRKEIKDLLSYFRLILNNDDDEAFKRIVNYPKRGIGETSVEKLSSLAIQFQTSIWRVASRAAEINLGLNTATLGKLGQFMQMISSFREAVLTCDAYDVAKEIAVKSGILKDLYTDKTPEGVSRYENVQELLNGVKDYSIREKIDNENITLSQFIENVSLLTNEDLTNSADIERITLMTIHSAKGLEFKHVFITGMEEELFPSSFSTAQLADIEEERRLFYVAITRAESTLCLTYAKSRYRWGQLGDSLPSRFLKEINTDYLELGNAAMQGNIFKKAVQEAYNKSQLTPLNKKEEKVKFSGFQKRQELTGNEKPYTFEKKNLTKISEKNPTTESGLKKEENGNMKVGTKVYHERFGNGIVTEMEGDVHETRAIIEFENSGKKQLLLKFAKLKIIG